MTNYEKIIKENAQKYYEDGTQKLSDFAFDALIDEVKKENYNSEVLKTGWGYETNENGKVKHKYGHIGSLDKIHNEKEFNNKFNNQNIKFDISAKLDGLSAVLYFKNGILDLALTRGDGEYGIDITDKIKYILSYGCLNNICLNEAFTGAIRGEIMILPEDFIEYKKNHPEAKNHRNSAAGLINGDNITDDYKYLKFIAYSIVGIEQNDIYVEGDKIYFNNTINIHNINTWLSENFKFVAPRVIRMFNNYTNFENELQDLKEKWSKDYYIDGIVVSDTNLKITENNEIVYNSCAFKFEDEKAITKVIDIEWNMSKNSEMIPVLQIKPVELEGTTVKRVTAFNAKFVEDNKLGSGATILICKRNQIIPYVMEVIEPAEFADLPSVCGYCNKTLSWDENHVHLYCLNNNCIQKENEDLKAVCLNLAPIEGLGWKTINKVFKDTFYQVHDYTFNTLEDILNADKIPGITGKGEKGLFNDMLTIIQSSTISVSKFLLALNVPGLGKIGAKRWEDDKDALKYLEYVVNTNMEYNTNYINLVKIIQDKNVIESLKTTYHDKINRYYNLLKNRLNVTNKVTNKGKICITGRLSVKRDDFEKLLLDNGWELSNTINKDTKYLITNTPESGTSKNKKADELGVKKITEKYFTENIL